MSDENPARRSNALDWGVKPLPRSEREGTRAGVGARQAPVRIRPPAAPSGGSAVPPPPPNPRETPRD